MNIPQIKINVTYNKSIKKSELINITSSKCAVDILKNIFSQDTFGWTEEMILLCLNRANKPIAYYKISSGGTSGTVCDPKVVFSIALGTTASGIIIAHNHPSGNLQPSQADNILTKKIKEGGELLDIKLYDHIILTEESYYSYADEGNL
jgi:DNA repair protein RadC